jgi:hypothetical protein
MNRLAFIITLVAIGWITMQIGGHVTASTAKPPARDRAIHALKVAAAYGYTDGVFKEPWSNVVVRVEEMVK